MNITNPFEYLSAKIPVEEREAIKQAVSKTYGHNHTQEDLETMFRVWNTYVTPDEPQDMNCSGCRIRVVGKLRNVVKLWE